MINNNNNNNDDDDNNNNNNNTNNNNIITTTGTLNGCPVNEHLPSQATFYYKYKKFNTIIKCLI